MIEAPLVRKMTLKKAADAAVPGAVLAATVTMANFLDNRRKQVPPHSVSRMAVVEAFLANEPIEAMPMTVVEPAVEEPI